LAGSVEAAGAVCEGQRVFFETKLTETRAFRARQVAAELVAYEAA
jgi:hypothetical protein